MAKKRSAKSRRLVEPAQGAFPDAAADPVNVLALELNEIDLILRAQFAELVRVHAWPAYTRYGACQKSERESAFNTMCARLTNPDLFPAIAIIWKESAFVSDADLAALGYKRYFGAEKVLCRYSLGIALWDEARCECETACECTEPDQGKFKAQAERAIEALLSFLLAEEDETGKPREVRGLAALNTIMREYTLFRIRLIKERLPQLVAKLDEGGEA